ncbi:sulfur carrier protein ThiS [Candidatus Phycosocius bacilliformis]|uniref:Sulfur carrier protein ThiS n=2 Tax=Candidatus Phycosocius bacilliformis TaxID=1445552 RepID=A0A2P2E8C0_9PROT|nr:sulfur carrier protein ThiS [Candidatus Phycosocius bacilliformis]GBF57305.1 sulfur carrier protein ThiS [Candidatus Phycosocius bacilliformis]
MIIYLNGEERQVPAGTSLPELIGQLELDPRGVAVERNREIVMKSHWDQTILAEGDQLELVQFVGGG